MKIAHKLLFLAFMALTTVVAIADGDGDDAVPLPPSAIKKKKVVVTDPPVTPAAVIKNEKEYRVPQKVNETTNTYINLNPTTSGTSSANPHDRQQFRDSMRDLQNANDASMRDLESNYHVDEESRLAIQLLRAKQFLNSLFQKERKAGRRVALPKSQPRQVVIGNRAAQAPPNIRGVDGEALHRKNAPTGVTFRDEQGEFHYGEIDGKKFKVRVAGDSSSQTAASTSRGATDLQNGSTDSTLTYDESGTNVAVYTNANAYNGGNVVSQGNVSAHAKAEQKQRIEKGAAEAIAFAKATPSDEKPKLSLADIAKQIALNGDFEEGTEVAAVAPELQNEILDDKLIIKSGRQPAHLDLNRAPSVLDTIAVADEKDYETLASKGADWRFLFEESLREGKARFASGEGLPVPWLFLGLITFGLAFLARKYLFGRSESEEAAPNIELDGTFLERAPDEIVTGDQHFDQYVYVLTQKERFAKNHALVTTHLSGMKEQLTPHTLYVRFDAQSNRWVIVRTDSRGNPGPAQGELQAGTVLDGEALGPSYQPGQRYELQSDGRWMKSFKEIKIVVALVVAKRQSGHY